jgi:hypothetical protein
VTTRYVADFLGFGHLIKGDQNPKAPYSENQIYQHITNCQIFFSYNADETKLLKRRKAFRSSMTFLYDLTKNGNIWQANRWSITGGFLSMGKRDNNPMVELGFKVAERVLKHERDAGRSAAVLLMVALDSAYNSVLAVSLARIDLVYFCLANAPLQFTSVLDYFMEDLYKLADQKDETGSRKWLGVQKLAIADNPESDKILTERVLEAQHISVRLPIIRTAVRDCDIKIGSDKVHVEEGEVVICDIVSTLLVFAVPINAKKITTELGKTKALQRLQREQLPDVKTPRKTPSIPLHRLQASLG